MEAFWPKEDLNGQPAVVPTVQVDSALRGFAYAVALASARRLPRHNMHGVNVEPNNK